MAISPLREKLRREKHKRKTSLTCRVSLRPACPLWDPISTPTFPFPSGSSLPQILINLYPGGWNDNDKLKILLKQFSLLFVTLIKERTRKVPRVYQLSTAVLSVPLHGLVTHDNSPLWTELRWVVLLAFTGVVFIVCSYLEMFHVFSGLTQTLVTSVELLGTAGN